MQPKDQLTEEEINYAYRLFYGENKTYKEIMNILNCSVEALNKFRLNWRAHDLRREGEEIERKRHTVPVQHCPTLVLVDSYNGPSGHVRINGGAWGYDGGCGLSESINSYSGRDSKMIHNIVGMYEQRIYDQGNLVERNVYHTPGHQERPIVVDALRRILSGHDVYEKLRCQGMSEQDIHNEFCRMV